MSDSRTVRDNPDLARLIEDGFAVRIVAGHLVIDDVPFVGTDKAVRRGSFLCPLDRDQDGRPGTHVMWFHGGTPCDQSGQPLGGINPSVGQIAPAPKLASTCGFSLKPPEGYGDFYEKVALYATIISGPAQAIDPATSPRTFKPLVTDEDDGVFKYLDTFSSRAGITAYNQRLAIEKVVVIGAGGTGSYLLDLLAKTPIRNIHIYDDDVFAPHNAFRSPGAADIEDLRAGQKKVEYLTTIYERMRRYIHPHSVRITQTNLHEILDADFVFLAMDPSAVKADIVDALAVHNIPFVDTGIGVGITPDGIGGLVRVTTGRPGEYGHIDRVGISAYDDDDDADYNTNIQVSELNMLAAAMAVLQFKQFLGFYADNEQELHTVFSIDDNILGHRFGRSEPPSIASTQESDSHTRSHSTDEPPGTDTDVSIEGDVA